jgi:hypothetical protein
MSVLHTWQQRPSGNTTADITISGNIFRLWKDKEWKTFEFAETIRWNSIYDHFLHEVYENTSLDVSERSKAWFLVIAKLSLNFSLTQLSKLYFHFPPPTEMEDDLNLFCKWKTTSIYFCKWKTNTTLSLIIHIKHYPLSYTNTTIPYLIHIQLYTLSYTYNTIHYHTHTTLYLIIHIKHYTLSYAYNSIPYHSHTTL